MDDADLVQRAAALDKDAFDAVYERYAARLYDYLWWVLQDQEEANFALYDTFLEAGARLHELPDPNKLRPWLFAIASDQALRHQRRLARRRDEDDDYEEHLDPTAVVAGPPPGDGAWGELVHVVRRIAKDLTPLDRALLDLRYRQALTDEELAEAIGAEPETAATLVAGVSQRVEKRLGETVVAFLARKDCPDLTALLGEWDRLDDEQRAVVESHAQTCPTCGERRRRRIPASALLGVSPALAVPTGVSTRILDDVDLTAHRGRPWSLRRKGFPRPLVGGSRTRDRRRSLALAGGAAGVLAFVGLVVFLLQQGDDATQRVSSVGQGSSSSSSTSRPTTTSTSIGPTTSSTAPPDGPAVGGPPTSRALTGSASGPGTGSGSGGTGSGGGGGGGGTSTGTTEPPPETTTTEPEPPPTTLPDASGPTLSGLSVSPSTVRAGGRCTNGDPPQATVSVTATDRSGIASISVSVAGAGGGRTDMAASGGGTYSAVIGPFESPLPAGFDFPTQVIVQAVDGAGNATAASSPLTLRCTA